jgi:hypothetical protein
MLSSMPGELVGKVVEIYQIGNDMCLSRLGFLALNLFDENSFSSSAHSSSGRSPVSSGRFSECAAVMPEEII